jgi:hypothetical protein
MQVASAGSVARCHLEGARVSPVQSPHRPRRLAAAAVALVVAAGLLGGCSGQREPSGYGDGVQKAFVDGCVTTAKADNEAAAKGDGSITEISDPQTTCECAYATLSGKDGIPFSKFKSINQDLIEEHGTVPKVITDAVANCTAKG